MLSPSLILKSTHPSLSIVSLPLHRPQERFMQGGGMGSHTHTHRGRGIHQAIPLVLTCPSCKREARATRWLVHPRQEVRVSWGGKVTQQQPPIRSHIQSSSTWKLGGMCNQATFLSRDDCAGIRDPRLGLSLKKRGGRERLVDG